MLLENFHTVYPYDSYRKIYGADLTAWTKSYETLEAGYRNLDESLNDPDLYMDEDIENIMKVITSYSHSNIFELLAAVKDALLELYSKLLSAFNNYLLNNIRTMDKYQNLVMDRFDKLKMSLKYQTYSYDGFYKYPVEIRDTKVEEETIQKYIAMIEDPKYDMDDIGWQADKIITEFGDKVIGAQIDPDNIKESVRDACYKLIRGSSSVETLTKENLREFIKEIRNYKKEQSELKSTREDILDSYKALKSKFSKAFKMCDHMNDQYQVDGLARVADPNKELLTNSQVLRYSNANTYLQKLLNAYISIYSEAFKTKLDIFKEKIEIERDVIVALMSKTNVLYSTNTKIPEKDPKNRPIEFATGNIIM